jgi:hypothetical protein
MGRSQKILTVVLMLPLLLYGVPYAYAAITSSTYVRQGGSSGGPLVSVSDGVQCAAGDYATGGGAQVNPQTAARAFVVASKPQFFDGTSFHDIPTGQPNAWAGTVETATGTATDPVGVDVWVVCQTPITVAGIGVPQFGSLYVAIALGAVVYFMLSRLRARRPTTSSSRNIAIESN